MWVVKGLLQVWGSSVSNIHEAARQGDIAAIKSFAQKITDIDEERDVGGVDSWSALQYAAWNGKAAAVAELCKLGASVEKVDKHRCSALHLAAMQGHKEAALKLLDFGVQVNVQDEKGMTALHRCAIEGHSELIPILMQHRANISVADKNGGTALHLAAWKGRMPVVCALLEWGAPTRIVDNDGNTPLHEAAAEGQVEIYQKLVQAGAPTDLRNKDGMLASDLLVRFGQEGVSRLTISDQVDQPSTPPREHNSSTYAHSDDGWGASDSASDWEEISSAQKPSHPVDARPNQCNQRDDDGWSDNESAEDWGGGGARPAVHSNQRRRQNEGLGAVGDNGMEVEGTSGGSDCQNLPSAPRMDHVPSTAPELYCGVRVVPLHDATQSYYQFSRPQVLSSSIFGTAFKGRIKGADVIVRKLSEQAEQDLLLLMGMKHPHLAQPFGVTLKPPHIFLPLFSATLEKCLFEGQPSYIHWKQRMQIALELTSALAYLESVEPATVMHSALDPSAIFLADNGSVKLIDFGIVKNNAENAKQELVQSFGRVILMLLTGRKPDTASFAADVKSALDRNSFHSMVDSNAGGWPVLEAVFMAQLALKCISAQLPCLPDFRQNVLQKMQIVYRNLQMAIPGEITAPYMSPGDGPNTVQNMDTSVPPPSIPPPHMFLCPITQEVMLDPVVASDGYTYERAQIQLWMQRGNTRSPMTNAPFEHMHLVPNQVLKSAILEWKGKPQHMEH